MFLCVMTMQGRADAQEKFKRVAKVVPIIAIETIRAIVHRELSAKADIKPSAMREIAHVSNRVTAHRKYPRFIRWIENQFVTGFFHPLPTRVNGVAAPLII